MPFLVCDVLSLERVQNRVTMPVKYFKNLYYNKRLEKLKLNTLEDWAPRDDLVQYYKEFSGTNIGMLLES